MTTIELLQESIKYIEENLKQHGAYKNCAMQNRKMLVWMWENKDKCFGTL